MQRVKIENAWITPTLTPKEVYLNLSVKDKIKFNFYQWDEAFKETLKRDTELGLLVLDMEITDRYRIKIQANPDTVEEFKNEIRDFIERVNDTYEIHMRKIQVERDQRRKETKQIEELQDSVRAINFYGAKNDQE